MIVDRIINRLRYYKNYLRTLKELNNKGFDNITYDLLYKYVGYLQYKDLLKTVQKKALKRIRRKDKVKIAFQASFLSTWIGDAILDLFADDERFDVYVVIVWQTNSDYDHEINQLKEHFRNKTGINTVLADGSVHPGDYDIIFYTSPYLSGLEKFSDNIPVTTLLCYVPYGFLLADITDVQFNLPIHNICWKNYTISDYYLKMADKYCTIGSQNMFFSGYPKLDRLAEENIGDNAHWKILPGANDKVKKIIYAPHHSIDSVPYMSTFHQNFEFFLHYAKEHPYTTSWVYKPHPLLRFSSVKDGVFSSVDEYDEYVKMWSELPNAVVEDGDYLPYFHTSDCMILDSISFMAEYMYINKPILFLKRKEDTFNEFGEIILSALEQCDGDDFDSITGFLENGLVNDNKKEEREKIFRANLDYLSINGKSANQYIYDNIVSDLF